MTTECFVCAQPADNPSDQMVIYLSPEPSETTRAIVHARCAATEIDSGRAIRWSPFAIRRVKEVGA